MRTKHPRRPGDRLHRPLIRIVRPRNLIKARMKRSRREGVAAVEFAIVAVPFFLLIFAILELGMVFVIDSILETATTGTGRLVRTGEADAKGFDKVRFKTELCSRMSVFEGDCIKRATVDVRVIPQFVDPDREDPTTAGVLDPEKTTYDGGQPGNLVLVRVWYEQPLITPFLNQGATRAGTGKVLLNSATAFRNEPWNA